MRALPFRSAAFRYLLGNTSSRVIAFLQVQFGLSKLDCAPVAAAVSASQQSPENVALCWRPWLAVRAIAGDGMRDLHHGRLPVPCSDTMRSSAAPSGPDA